MEQKQSSTTQKIQEKTETITTASVAQEESISYGKKKKISLGRLIIIVYVIYYEYIFLYKIK